MQLLRILIILLLFSIPLGVLSRITISPGFSFYLHDLLVLLIFLNLSFLIFIKKKKTTIGYIKKPFLIFFFVMLSSLLVNFQSLTFQNLLIALSYLLRYILYFCIIFSVSLFEDSSVKLFKKIMVISGFIFVVFGYVQYLYYSDLQNLFYLGWDEHLARFFSTFFDPNFTGSFLVLYFIFIVDSLIVLFRAKNRMFLLFLLISAATLIGIYFTYSRSAFVMLIAGIATYLMIKSNTRVLLITLISLIVVFFLFSNPVVEEFNPFRIASSRARLDSFRGAGSIFINNPVLGVGFNAYRYAQIRYGYRNEIGGQTSNADAGTDNSFIFILATSGLIGFVSFINLWRVIIFKLLKTIKREKSFSVVVFASLISLFINSLFINSLFYSLILIWIFVLVGIVNTKK